MKLGIVQVGAAVAALLAGATAEAQVTREADVTSVAGLLGADESYQAFTFMSSGGEILFADVDSDLYQDAGRRAGDHEDGHTDEGGGCTHDDASGGCATEEDSGGCTDGGGPGGLCLQVIGPDDELVCWADRPMRPGWQRDPRLVCALPVTQRPVTYSLRVTLRGEEGSCGGTDYPEPLGSELPYLLNVSLRTVAPVGPLQRAGGISVNRL